MVRWSLRLTSFHEHYFSTNYTCAAEIANFLQNYWRIQVVKPFWYFNGALARKTQYIFIVNIIFLQFIIVQHKFLTKALAIFK